MATPDLPSPIVLEEIFRVAAVLPAVERAAYLETACEGRPEMRARVERMLEVGGIAALLQQGANETVPLEIEAELPQLKAEEDGERVGNYKLLQQIGEGGFGVVWMAEQIEPVRRRVALKIIKLGMDTKEVIARFEQERQALAMMDHSNIAKVFDAGTTPTGRPFFVMELVRGIKITDYCDQANLATAERLALFIAVCHAVQHAHQKGIIHRDIKPSNILVTLHDGVPVPKVIDFGVAKATQSQRLTDLTLFTQFEQMIGTPLYMSPEQAEMSGLDIDTRSDIYSLGVLLYELLTGRTPFDPEELMRKGYDEIRRVIREQEPQKPSTALSTMAVDARTTIAQHRQADSAKLLGLIRGDLDWIVMKALEKDRTRRYESASGLALDLQRHLQSEPVLARPPSFGYKAGKFVRKYKRGVIAAAAVLLAVLAGLVASTVLYLGKRAAWTSEYVQRQKAEQNAQEAEAVSTFLASVFTSPNPERDGHSITVSELLQQAAQRLDTDLASQPARLARFQAIVGSTYRSLGLSHDAIPLQEKSRNYHLAALGLEHHETLDAMHNLAMSYQDAGRRDEALQLQEEVLPLYKKILGPEHPDTLRAMHNLAFSYGAADRRVEALQLQEEVLKLFRKVLGPEHSHTLGAMGNLADLFGTAGRPADALQLREEVLTLRRRVNGPEHVHTLGAMHNLANSYYDAGRPGEALQLQVEVLPLYRTVIGHKHPDTLRAMHNLAHSYRAAGRPDEALKLQEEVLELFREVNGNKDPFTLVAMGNLADLFSDAGRRDEALDLREKVLKLRRETLSPEHAHTLLAMRDLAKSYTDAHRHEEALKLREDALVLHRKVNDPRHPDTLTAISDLALSYSDAGRRDEALKMLEEVLKLRREVHGDEHLEVAAALGNMGEYLLVSGDFPAAEVHLLESWKIAELPRTARADVQRQILAILVQLYDAWSKTDATRSAAFAEWKQKLADLDHAHPEQKPRQP